MLKQIPQFIQHLISEDGTQVRNQSGRLLKIGKQIVKGKETGYLYVTMLADDYSYLKRVAVHRLVAFAWLHAPISDKHVWINHKDGNKANNHMDNLEWTTISQNIQHAFDTGLKSAKKGIKSRLYGRKAPLETRIKMSEAKLGSLHPKFKGIYIVNGKRFESANQAGKFFKIPPKTIINRAKSSKHVDYTFIPK